MDIKDLALKMLGDQLGGKDASAGGVQAAIGKLIGNGDNVDISGLLEGFKEKGLGNVVDSWLGDGGNEEVSPEQLKEVIGADKIQAAAADLGTDENSLLAGLKDSLPSMIDKASSGGNLLESVDLGALGNLAKKFF